MSGTPDFIIIGAMKCATSTLHEQLARQPGIFMTTPKEPYFFSDADIRAKGLDWYRALFADARPGDLTGESSTHYTMLPTYPDAVRRIRETLVDTAKFIYVMRDPVERLVSHWIHDWSQGLVSGEIDTAIAAHSELIEYGRYAYQLRPYLETFGPARVLPVFFEHLTAHPQVELGRICTFLGYRGSPVWHTDRAHENRSDKRLRGSPLLALLKNFPGSRTLRRTLIPEHVRERIKRRWRIEERPLLSPEALAQVRATFDDDLQILGRWLDLDLTCVTFQEVAEVTRPTWSPQAFEAFPHGER
jgi:hypothetical protein